MRSPALAVIYADGDGVANSGLRRCLVNALSMGYFKVWPGSLRLVELRGLEPLSPCLQIGPNCRKQSLTWGWGTVASAGVGSCRILLWSSLVVSVGQLHGRPLHLTGARRVSVPAFESGCQGGGPAAAVIWSRVLAAQSSA
jgi:hypothetical protein